MTGMSELFCLICNTAVDESTRVNICTSFLHNGESLASFVQQVLRSTTSELRSSYICLQCYNLFQMLERAQLTVTNICCEILKVYLRSKNERAIKQQPPSKEHSLVENLEQNKVSTSDAVNRTKSTSFLKPVSDEIDVALQTFSEEAVLSQDLSVLNIDTVTDINVMKIIKSTNLKRKGTSCFNKEDTACHTIVDNAKSISSNSDIINDNIVKVVEYSKPLDINVDILDHSAGNSIVLRKDQYVSDNNSVRQKNTSYAQQLECRIEMIKSNNKSHIHVSEHEGSQKYQNLESRLKLCDTSEMGKAKDLINTVAKTNVNVFNLPQNNQAQKQNLQTRQIDTNIVESKVENTLEKKINRNTAKCNANVEVKSHLLSTSWQSQRSLKPLEYLCATCGKKWKTSTELKTHVKTHSTTRPYMCEKCGQAYKHKHALEVHVGMHNGINPFQCTHCKKCFTQKGALMRHLPIHTGETPYQCELCGKRFVHHTSYNMHILSHTGKKSYQCKVCDMSLLSTSHLKRHMRVHTGEKPYSCNLCGKRFAERYNLFAHHKIHDPDEITTREKKKIERKCKHCNLIFNKKEELDIHLKCHDNSDKSEEKKLIDCIFNIDRNAIEASDNHILRTQTQDINTKGTNLLGNANEQIWIESDNHVRLQNSNNSTKFVLLESSLPHFDTSSLVTFNNQNFSAQGINCDTSLQIVANITDHNR